MEQYKFINLFEFRGVPIKIHWSLSVVLLIALIIGFTNRFFLFAALSLALIMLIHELGHMWFASRLGLRTYEIRLYLIHGICEHEEADTDYENYVIAWGGVVAQALIFVPCILVYFLLGKYLSPSIVTLLVLLGFYNFILAIFNLLPIRPLDGASCWRTVPLYFKFGKAKLPHKKKGSKPKKKRHLKSVK